MESNSENSKTNETNLSSSDSKKVDILSKLICNIGYSNILLWIPIVWMVSLDIYGKINLTNSPLFGIMYMFISNILFLVVLNLVTKLARKLFKKLVIYQSKSPLLRYSILLIELLGLLIAIVYILNGK